MIFFPKPRLIAVPAHHGNTVMVATNQIMSSTSYFGGSFCWWVRFYFWGCNSTSQIQLEPETNNNKHICQGLIPFCGGAYQEVRYKSPRTEPGEESCGSANTIVRYPWVITPLSGWWYNYPSEKYNSQLGVLSPIFGNIKHVPNHQPVVVCLAAFQLYNASVLIFPLCGW